jgi:hypothetical protein
MKLSDVVVYRVTDAFRGPRLVKATYVGELITHSEFPYVKWVCLRWFSDPVLRKCFPHSIIGENTAWNWRMALTPDEAWDKYEINHTTDKRRSESHVNYHGECLRKAVVRRPKDVWEGK